MNLTYFRFANLVDDQVKQNRFSAECMLVISAIMHLGASGLPDKAITRDDSDRLQLCLKVLCDNLREIITILGPIRVDSDEGANGLKVGIFLYFESF